MRPKYVTSYRPHGKWGDFLVCIIPVSWCINILINSNFILRLIEWQNESSLFTIRVRARQWYWVYKFELKSLTDILSTPKNVGNNHWQINVFGELQSTDDYLHILQLRSQNEWIKTYWEDTLKKFNKTKKTNVVSFQEQIFTTDDYATKTSDTLKSSFFVKNALFLETFSFYSFLHSNIFYEGNFDSELNKWNWAFDIFNQEFFSKSQTIFDYKFFNAFGSKIADFSNFAKSNMLLSLVLHNPDFTENLLDVKKQNGAIVPVRFLKNSVDSDILRLNKFESQESLTYDIFGIRFNNDNTIVSEKNVPYTTYLTIKQKRYKRKKNIPARVQNQVDANGIKTKLIKRSWKPLLIDNSVFIDNNTESLFNPTRTYRMLKKNKNRSELFSVNTSRRMLRTKRTLVIPAHVNLTLIANSYDVVHAWWIPGLGIKIDCIPGRSTHHTFFVDNVGFYYGQCAEICGRYHHHMPIRICALPFEHFLVWWYSYGLPKLLFTRPRRRFDIIYGFRQYVW